MAEALQSRPDPASIASVRALTDVTMWRALRDQGASPADSVQQASAVVERWLEAGGHWLGLHGTSGGRAQRVEGVRNRRTVTTEHHALLGSMFLTHPPLCKFRVDVQDTDHPLTKVQNVTLSAHSAFRTPEASENLIAAAWAHCRRIAKG